MATPVEERKQPADRAVASPACTEFDAIGSSRRRRRRAG